MIKWLSKLINDILAKSFQKKANKLFDKSNVEYQDGDNT